MDPSGAPRKNLSGSVRSLVRAHNAMDVPKVKTFRADPAELTARLRAAPPRAPRGPARRKHGPLRAAFQPQTERLHRLTFRINSQRRSPMTSMTSQERALLQEFLQRLVQIR